MFEALYAIFNDLLGLNLEKLTVFHMIARVIIVYIVGVGLMQWHKRFIGEKSTLDVILVFVIGNMFASAIDGSAQFFPTLGAAIAIVCISWILSLLSFYFPAVEVALSGKAQIIYQNNNFNWPIMRKYHISQEDFFTALRRSNITDIKQVDTAYFESSGEISIIQKKSLASL